MNVDVVNRLVEGVAEKTFLPRCLQIRVTFGKGVVGDVLWQERRDEFAPERSVKCHGTQFQHMVQVHAAEYGIVPFLSGQSAVPSAHELQVAEVDSRFRINESLYDVLPLGQD